MTVQFNPFEAVEQTVNIGALTLDSGVTVPDVDQRVTIYGSGQDDRRVLIAHALTGSSRIAEWWPAIIGDGGLFDAREWTVIGINTLGGCYGSTGPTSLAPDGRPYGKRFPPITVRDLVRAQMLALDRLGIERLAFVVGGSLGGMQALQWALDAPARVDHTVMIGAHDHHSAMGIALNGVQREALELDAVRGLRLARKIAMLTYKSEALLRVRHDRREDRFGKPCFDVEGYLDHQADLFEERMDAASYAALTHAMDSFDARSTPARSTPIAPALTFVGITSDWLFRPEDVRAAAERFAERNFATRYLELRSEHGHDAFLAEPDALARLLRQRVESAR